MTRVGLVGGLGPESTIDYYRRILEAWQRETPLTAPSLLIDSVDVRYALSLVEHQKPALIVYLLASIERLAGAGVTFAAITANTPHIVFGELVARSSIPLLSIVEVCAAEAKRRGFVKLALLGTRFTMDAAFYPDVFSRNGLSISLPSADEKAWVHDRYMNQLLKGDFRDETRAQFIALIDRLRRDENIDAVVLGGTELPLLLRDDVIAGVPVLDTTALHVAAIVQRLRA